MIKYINIKARSVNALENQLLWLHFIKVETKLIMVSEKLTDVTYIVIPFITWSDNTRQLTLYYPI